MTTYVYPTSTTGVSDSFADHVARGSVNPGTDYVAPYGSQVVAVASGTVTNADGNNDGSGGRTIHIDHDDGSGSDYLHMSVVGVSAGQWVAQGTPLGSSGASGYNSDWYYGPHLHISFRYNHAHGYGNSGNVDFDAIMTSQPTTPTEEEEMSNIVHDPSGTLALAGSDGSFTILTDMDQVGSLQAAGIVPLDQSRWVWAPDGLIFSKLQQVADARTAENNPAEPVSTTRGNPAQWIIGAAGLLLVVLALVVVPILTTIPGVNVADLSGLEKFLIAGGLALLGVAAGSLQRSSSAPATTTPRHASGRRSPVNYLPGVTRPPTDNTQQKVDAS